MKQSMTSMARLAISAAVLAACVGVALAATPTEQKAIVQTGNGGPEVLKYQSIPVLQPGKDQVLIKVYAAAVNPVDWKMRQGMGGMGMGAGPAPGGEGMGGAPGGPPPAGAPAGAPPGGGGANTSVPGLDVAGVVEKVGEGVTSLKVGDPVFSMIGRTVQGLNGGYSQYVVAPASNVIPKPKNLTYAEAAGLGTASMTGVKQVDSTPIQKGTRVLITGVAGGVGSTAAQAAKAKGAYVIGTASAKHNAYLKSIGVDEVIDYTKVKFEEQAKNIDVVIDTIGSDTAERSLKTLKKGGTFTSVGGRIDAAKCTEAGVTCAAGGPGGAGEGVVLTEVGKLAGEGKLKVNVDAKFPLEKAADAQEENRNGGTQGKIILVVDAAQVDKK